MDLKWWPRGDGDWVNLEQVVRVLYVPPTGVSLERVARGGPYGPGGRQEMRQKPGEPARLHVYFADGNTSLMYDDPEKIREILGRLGLELPSPSPS